MGQADKPTDEVAEMVVALRHVATAKKRRLRIDHAARIYLLIVAILAVVAVAGAVVLFNLIDTSHSLLRAIGL